MRTTQERRSAKWLVIALLLAAGPAFGQRLQTTMVRHRLSGKMVPAASGQIVVLFKPGVSVAQASLLHRQTGARGRVLPDGRLWVVDLPAGMTVAQGIAAYERSARVQAAEPDYVYRVVATARARAERFAPQVTIPADPLWAGQWGPQKIECPNAWDLCQGDPNVVIAIVDTGVFLAHEDLDDHIWVNPGEIPGNDADDDGNGFTDDVNGWDFADDDNNPDARDDFGDAHPHGTHCAGIASAEADNSQGIAGVGWSCTIMPVRVLDAFGYGWDSDVMAGIEYAAANGADVISLSIGGPYSAVMQTSVDYAYAQGAIIVCAMGNEYAEITTDSSTWGSPVCNDDIDPSSGGALNRIVGVWASDSSDQKADFSNYSGAYSFCDVGAPGVDILSTTYPPNTYESAGWSGTSMATPHVAGVAALIKTLSPGLTNADIIQRILDTADPVDSVNPGYAGKLGAGRVNAYQPLRSSAPAVYLASHETDDDAVGDSAGNGDGSVDPGETIELTVELVNHGLTTALSASGELTTTTPGISITQGIVAYGDIPEGVPTPGSQPFVFGVDPTKSFGDVIDFELSVTASSGGPWGPYGFQVFIGADGPLRYAGHSAEEISGDGDGVLEPGETVRLVVALGNDGQAAAVDVQAMLISPGGDVSILDDQDAFGTVEPGAIAYCQGEYVFVVPASVGPGDALSFVLKPITATNGATQWMDTVVVSFPDEMGEPDNSPSHAFRLATDGTRVSRSLDPGDEDWFKFDAVAGVSYVLQAHEPLGSSAAARQRDQKRLAKAVKGADVGAAETDTYMYAYVDFASALANNSFATDDDGGSGFLSRIVFTATQTSIHYIKIRGWSSVTQGPYDITVLETDPQSGEPDGTPDEAKAIPTDGSRLHRALDPGGDVDWFKFDAVPGTSYVIEAHDPGGSSAAPRQPDRERPEKAVKGADVRPAETDTYLYAYVDLGNALAGNWFARDDDGGPGLLSRIEFTATLASTHYIKLEGYWPDEEGPYDISVTGRPPASGPLVVDHWQITDPSPAGNGNGRIEPGEVIQLYVWIRNDGAETAAGVAGTLATTNPSVVDSISLDTDTYGDIAPDQVAGSEWGDYYAFHVSDTAQDLDNLGLELTISATNGSQTWIETANLPPRVEAWGEPDDTYDQARPINADGTAYQRAFEQPADQDWFQVSLSAGTTYVIETFDLGSQGSAEATTSVIKGQIWDVADTVIVLYKPGVGGLPEELASDDDSGEGLGSKIVWACSETRDDYLIQAQHYSDQGTGNYKLRVTPDDGSPPRLTQAAGAGLQAVDLVFSEIVGLSTAQNPTNYVVSPSLTVQGAERQPDGVTVRLTTGDQDPATSYTVTVSNVEDNAGNPVQPGPDASASWLPAGDGLASHQLADVGYYMISFPLIPPSPTPDALLSDDLGDGAYYMWGWGAGGYQSIPTSAPASQTTTLDIQEGYWLLAPASTIGMTGAQAITDQVIPLQTGWNMVAAPHEATMDSLLVDNAGDVRSLAAAQSAGWVLATFYYSHDGTGSYNTLTVGQTPADTLSLWVGYWVLAGLDCSLIVPVAPPAGPTATTAALRETARFAWAFNIQARSGSSADSITIAAADPASEGFDGFALDKPKPPASPGEGTVRLVLRPQAAAPRGLAAASELAMETKGPQAGEWHFTLTGGVEGDTVTLSWPELSLLPKDRVAILTDRDTGQRTFMRTRAQCEFAAPGVGSSRSFTLSVKRTQDGALLISGLTAMPTRAGTWDIGFDLSADAAVTARIYNVAGRRAADIAQAQQLPEGRASLTWNARSIRGTTVPSGTYLLRLTARTEDGEQASAVTMLQVAR